MGILSKVHLKIANGLGLPKKYQHDYLLDEWVKKEIKRLPKNTSIIDVGAGERKYRKFCRHLKYTSQDASEYNGEGDGEGLQTGSWDTSKMDIVSDITSIPVKDGTFDAVLCTEVFEHVPDPQAALAELYRILKNGGALILTAPFMSETHFAPYHFCSGFDRYWFTYHLKRTGFCDIEITPYGNLYSNFLTSMDIVMGYKKIPKWKKALGLLYKKAMIKYAMAEDDSYKVACFGYNIVAKKA